MLVRQKRLYLLVLEKLSHELLEHIALLKPFPVPQIRNFNHTQLMEQLHYNLLFRWPTRGTIRPPDFPF
jgi:hypothetical protein